MSGGGSLPEGSWQSGLWSVEPRAPSPGGRPVPAAQQHRSACLLHLLVPGLTLAWTTHWGLGTKTFSLKEFWVYSKTIQTRIRRIIAHPSHAFSKEYHLPFIFFVM